ncbi:unnamed protein product [Hydatigera taeniaeformis]|uniref:LAGLIDADG_2 domain-containing protein n=1 Tax=Hydatigena taeniaeformis TaxID=6205 RepID=A0A0R3X6I8_HYDTA|nr:unnamed protein product [Hydatigera taeniaeformis]
MVLVQRLTLLAANLVDGHEIIAASKRNGGNEQGSVYSNGHISKGAVALKLTPIQREYAVFLELLFAPYGCDCNRLDVHSEAREWVLTLNLSVLTAAEEKL